MRERERERARHAGSTVNEMNYCRPIHHTHTHTHSVYRPSIHTVGIYTSLGMHEYTKHETSSLSPMK